MQIAINRLVPSIFALLFVLLLAFFYLLVHSSFGGKHRRIYFFILEGSGLILGISLVALSSIQLWRGFQSRHWETIGGTVTESVYTSGRRPTSPWNGYFTDYEHGKITYKYNIDGTNFVSHDLTVDQDDPFVNGDLAEYVRNHRVGDDVIIYFNPQDPQSAVLLPGPRFINAVGGFLGIIVAAAAVTFGLRRKYRQFQGS